MRVCIRARESSIAKVVCLFGCSFELQLSPFLPQNLFYLAEQLLRHFFVCYLT